MLEVVPFDPSCGKFAKDMPDYDMYILMPEDIEAGREEATPEEREEYVRTQEGTYNPSNGHFLCDACYIEYGQPSSPTGWKCP